MKKTLSGLFTRKRKRHAAGGWFRTDNDIVKYGRFGDGAITSLLIGNVTDAQLEAAYGELKDVGVQRHRSFVALFSSYVFAVLMFFEASDSLALAGVGLRSEAWPHIAVAIITFFSWRFGSLQTKFSYTATWFEHIYSTSDSNRKAWLLARFPAAFLPFQYLRTIRGFPKFVWPTRWPRWDGMALRIFLVVLLGSMLFPLAIFGYGLHLVWISSFPTPVLAKLYVGCVVFLGLFSIANPSFSSIRRPYTHYGLSSLLSSLPKERSEEWHRAIAQMRVEREGDSP